jgi:hypothetical protein
VKPRPGTDALAQRLIAIRQGRSQPDWHGRLLDFARDLTMAEAGAVLAETEGGIRALAPVDLTDVPEAWSRAAETARLAGGVAALEQGGGAWLMVVPVEASAVLVVRVRAASPVDLALTRERLALLAALAQSVTATAELTRLVPAAAAAEATEALLAAADRETGLRHAAAKLAGLLPPATQLALGLEEGRRVGTVALSDQPNLIIGSAYGRALALLMEEALDAEETLSAPGTGATSAAARAWPEALAGKTLIAIPAPAGGAAAVVIWHDRPPQRATETVAGLLVPGLNLLATSARTVAPRRLGRVRLRRATPLLVVAGLVALAAVLPRSDEVVASFVIQPERVQAITAPFDGVLEASDIRPGDRVTAGTVLGRLGSRELALEAAAMRARAANDQREAAIARAGGRPADEMIALLSARRAEAQLALLEYRMTLAEIRTPVDGVVLAGDLRRSLGQSLSRGQSLFEIAPPGSLRAEILLPETRAHLVQPGHKAVLAPAADPASRVPARIDRVRPIAEIVQGRNVFRAIATLETSSEQAPELLRPGAEGLARVTIGETTWLRWIFRDPVLLVRRWLWI